jgi:hypothetical protein
VNVARLNEATMEGSTAMVGSTEGSAEGSTEGSASAAAAASHGGAHVSAANDAREENVRVVAAVTGCFVAAAAAGLSLSLLVLEMALGGTVTSSLLSEVASVNLWRKDGMDVVERARERGRLMARKATGPVA